MDLQELRARIASRDSLRSEQEALFQKETELREQLRREGMNLQYEESDVEEMEGTNLKSIFYTVIGKKEERLNREIDEAEAARAQYERTKSELEEVKKRIKQIERELKAIDRAEADYKKQVREIEDRIREVETRMSEADAVTLSIIRRELAELDQKQDCYARIKAAGAEIMCNVESVQSTLREMYQESRYGNPFTEHELYKEANEIKAQIESGAVDFADAAREHSSCPSKAEGGSLGEFGRGQMVPEFDAACFDMQVGELRGPVKTQFGFHLIRLDAKNEAKTPALSEVRDRIYGKLMQDKQEAAYQSKINQLKIVFPVDKF